MSDEKCFYIGAQSNDYPVHDADRTAVARIFDEPEARRLMTQANASPRLYAALERLRDRVRTLGNTPVRDLDESIAEADAALAAARGEQA